MPKIFLPLLLIVFLVLPVAATAGYVQVPQTGQITCSDVGGRNIDCAGSGQDAGIRAGLSWPSPRFQTNGDGTVTDALSGLVWSRDANVMPNRNPSFDGDGNGDGKVTWQHALDYVAALNRDKYLGHEDWRLPNLNELESLFNAQENSTATWLGGMGFLNVRAEGYWTSTTNAANDSQAWAVDFRDGRIYFSGKTAPGPALQYVWPVRGAVTVLPATGQTTSFSPFDDGAVRMGLPLQENRFSDNRDSTVRDELTGLIWTKDANAPGPMECGPRRTKVWEDAFAYLKCINGTRYLGHDDWRLPNRNELRTLLDYGKGAIPRTLAKAGFINVQANKYWTSTNVMYNAYAWFIDLDNSFVDYRFKTTNYYVWPVRGGWGVDPGKYNLKIAIGGTGAVAMYSDTANDYCSSGMGYCNFSVANGATVTLTATPASGFRFSGWTGTCNASEGPCRVTMDGPASVTATFQPTTK